MYVVCLLDASSIYNNTNFEFCIRFAIYKTFIVPLIQQIKNQMQTAYYKCADLQEKVLQYNIKRKQM